MSLPVTCQPNQILWNEKKSQKILCCKSLNCLSKDFVTPRNKDMHIKPKENFIECDGNQQSVKTCVC